MDLIDYVDEINTAHGATREVFSTNTPEAQALRKRVSALFDRAEGTIN